MSLLLSPWLQTVFLQLDFNTVCLYSNLRAVCFNSNGTQTALHNLTISARHLWQWKICMTQLCKNFKRWIDLSQCDFSQVWKREPLHWTQFIVLLQTPKPWNIDFKPVGKFKLASLTRQHSLSQQLLLLNIYIYIVASLMTFQIIYLFIYLLTVLKMLHLKLWASLLFL